MGRRLHAVTFYATVAVAGGVLLLATVTATANSHTVPAWRSNLRVERPETVSLPPWVLVEERDLSGETWEQSGRVWCSLEEARRDVVAWLRRQGWRVEQRMALSTSSPLIDLVIFVRANKPGKLLLMLWESGPGTTGFSLGQVNGAPRMTVRKGSGS